MFGTHSKVSPIKTHKTYFDHINVPFTIAHCFQKIFVENDKIMRYKIIFTVTHTMFNTNHI